MSRTFSGKEYVYDILHTPSERDRQTLCGASDLSDPCTKCLAEKMVGGGGHQSEYDMGAKIGTAIHEYLELNNKDPNGLKEQRVVIGEIPGYGEIKSTTDLYLKDQHRVIDWKTTTLDKLTFIKRAYENVPDDLDVSNVRSARAKINRYTYQTMLYGMGVKNSLHLPVQAVSIIFIPRDGKKLERDIWSMDMPYSQTLADKVWSRACNLWAWLEAGNDWHDLPSDPECYVCNVVRTQYELDNIEVDL